MNNHSQMRTIGFLGILFLTVGFNCMSVAQPSSINSNAVLKTNAQAGMRRIVSNERNQVLTLSTNDNISVDQLMMQTWLKHPQEAVYAAVGKRLGGYSIEVDGHTNIIAYKPLLPQRFDLHLYDANGKAVSKTWWAWWNIGATLKLDAKLLDGAFKNDEGFGYSREVVFGPRSLGEIGGESPPAWIADFNIFQCFRIKEPGEYRLQVQVRLFTKDAKGVFQPFILPPVETRIDISANDLGK